MFIRINEGDKFMRKKWYDRITLRIAGLLEIIIASIVIASIFYVLTHEKTSITIGGLTIIKDTPLSLLSILFLAIFQIVAGMIALIYANSRKMRDTCLILGMILLLLQVLTLNKVERTFSIFISDVISLLVPFFYVYGATRKIKESKR